MITSPPHIGGPLLKQMPPRPLPPWLIIDLIGDQLAERPLRAYIDPLLICGIIAAIALALLRAPIWLSWILTLLIGLRLGIIVWEFLGRSLADLRLLRSGLILRAHVLRSRPARTVGGEVNGRYIDCVIPITRTRTSVGSLWLFDAQEAERLAAQGRVQVLVPAPKLQEPGVCWKANAPSSSMIWLMKAFQSLSKICKLIEAD